MSRIENVGTKCRTVICHILRNLPAPSIDAADIVINYIKAGALLPLDEYLPEIPSFTKRYKDLIPYWRLNSEDSKLYNWETAVPRHLDTDI